MNVTPRLTLIIAILVLFLGKYINKKLVFLRDFNIPEPVTGGVLTSIAFGLIYWLFGIQFEFALEMRDSLLLVFFTTIGLSSKVKTLIRGGKPLLILSVASLTFLIIQNLTGVVVAGLTGLDLPVGVLAGSVSLSGGHGTTIAWSQTFVNNYGIANAAEIGIASATFGLILGGVIGGPIAKLLINRHRLKSSSTEPLTVGIEYEMEEVQVDYNTMLKSILVISVAIGLGTQLNVGLAATGLKMPDFVVCLFMGILLTNLIPVAFKNLSWPSNTPSMALIADISLGLFLAISLMSLELWSLVDLAGAVVLLLLSQLVIITFFAIFVIFRLMGKTYDAAVIAGGYVGLGLGATPTAIANMTAITEEFGPSPQAFIIVPLVGAFFIDISNALIIQRFLNHVG
ncbi:MAG: sodium/glutamate symporter [Xenococcaceae cyanobacterium MO_167.B52]|nr:sodium/glutamate symporter [Xenococcaceae cyanobacterium MO_167.B52]